MELRIRYLVVGVVFFLGVAAVAAPQFHSIRTLPSELDPGLAASSAAGQVIDEWQWQLPRVEWQQSAPGDWLPLTPSGQWVARSEHALVPRFSRRFVLPTAARASVYLSDVVLEESEEPVRFALTPKPLQWDQRNKLGAVVPLSAVGSYPERWLEAIQEGTDLQVNLYPVRLQSRSGLAYLLRSAKVVVVQAAHEAIVEDSGHTNASAESLILVSENMKTAAEKLQAFHLQKYGIVSEIVTVESVAKAESPIAESELPDGYKNPALKSALAISYDAGTGRGYHYDLARKLIQFFRKRISDGKIRYATLLGTAEQIPPSYYYSVGSGFNSTRGVTDQCYSSEKQCMQPRFALGRLSLRSLDEMNRYLAKVDNWLLRSPDASSELALYGGKAFPGDFYIAEMGILRTLEAQDSNWRGLKKFFRTKQNYNRAALWQAISGELPSPFIYHLDHGSGNVWHIEKEQITAQAVQTLTKPGSQLQPLVVSIACSNAAFDIGVTSEKVLVGPSSSGNSSVGVELVRSPAGVVAYVGSARPAIGNPIYHVDEKGNLNITGSTYGLQLMEEFFDLYHDRKSGRLGDFYLESMKSFLKRMGNAPSDPAVQYTFLNLALLGDPLIAFPQRKVFDDNLGHPLSTTEFAETSGSFPVFRFKDASDGRLQISAGGPFNATLLKRLPSSFFSDGGESVVATSSHAAGDEVILKNAGEKSEGNYFLRLENSKGVPMERQVWFSIEP